MAGFQKIAARESMMRHGYDPIEELVALSKNSADPLTKQRIAEVLMPYMYPKLANVAVEVDDPNGRRRSDTQAALMNKILTDPALADAASRLSLAAADMELARVIDVEPISGEVQ